MIVGASAAGISAALALRRLDYRGTITVVDGDPHPPYERPPLSKALLDDTTGGLVPIVPWSTYADLEIDLRLGERVTAIDPGALKVHLGGGEQLDVDRLVLATGVTARHLALPHADADNVLTLRDATDAARLSAQLARGGPLVIIGAGFIGLELAAVARQRGIDVTVVEAQPRPLANIVGPEVASLVVDLHRGHGVRLITGATVERFAATGSTVEQVVLSTGHRLDTATVVVGIGVQPRTELGTSARVDVDHWGFPVNEFGQTSRAWIFAAGDVASQAHPHLATRGRLEHWDTAQRHGAAVGSTVAGEPVRYKEAPYAWSDQYDATLQIIGRPRGTDQVVIREGATPQRFLAFWLRDGRLAAAAGMDASREIGIARRLVASTVLVDNAVLADAATDLRALLKPHRPRSPEQLAG
ncbi:pyridine nucleotide-disulfide oxidoreductase [Lentzea cavernae]|uniref:Pyridine nucleotide-disulfide oxidoreductase n=1 Tax=Lentzea cavernae TaxID=2020703 RepID=A0ABQ3M6F6_9PSEU|nr:pyridine nucleotide-disulfide oxidoreductase [Lentzea cavernae]